MGGAIFFSPLDVFRAHKSILSKPILVLTHVRELIQQNYLGLTGHWPMAPAGVYSAGLKRRESNSQTLFAGVQSAHNKVKEIAACDLILIDEAHLCCRYCFTAAHYRLDSGLLTEGENRVFTDVAYKVSVKQLIDEKWLAPLITEAPVTELDVSGVYTRDGEFIPGELATAVDKSEVNSSTVK